MKKLKVMIVLLLFVLVGLVLLGRSAKENKHASEKMEDPPGFDFETDLKASHPEIFANQKGDGWIKSNDVAGWYETPLVDGVRTVVAEAEGGGSALAALLSYADNQRRLLKIEVIDLRSVRPERGRVRNIVGEKLGEKVVIQRIRPFIVFDAQGALFAWEIKVTKRGEEEVYTLGNDLILRQLEVRDICGLGEGASQEISFDDLSHPGKFKRGAEKFARGKTTDRDKAKAIFDGVFRCYNYDAGDEETLDGLRVKYFTLADNLVVDRGRRGACDELSVIQVSYLRALGIDAKLKYFIWLNGKKKLRAHAAVEYYDKELKKWMASDIQYGFNTPGVYRNMGLECITVMDAVDPNDKKCKEKVHGVPDNNDVDGILNPYGDLKLDPAYPGKADPAYSDQKSLQGLCSKLKMPKLC